MAPRRLPFVFVVLVAVLGNPVLADDVPVRAPIASGSFEGGAVTRNTTLTPGGPGQPASAVRGTSPWLFRVKAEYFPLRWLGGEVDALLDSFQALTQQNERLGGPSRRLSARGAVALRFLSRGGFHLSGSLGYAAWSVPYIRLDAGALPQPEVQWSHGPALRVTLGYQGERFEALAGAIALVPVGRTWGLEPLAWVGARVAEIGPTALWVGANASALLEGGTVASAGFQGDYAGLNLRFSVGVKVSLLPPRPPSTRVEGEGAGGPTMLEVAVALPDGSPAAGALVAIDEGAATPADAKGVFAAAVGPGAHAVKVTLAGYRGATSSANAVEGARTKVPVRLEPLTGPGALSGVVRAAASGKPLAEVTVTAGELPPVTTGDDGAYRFEKLGPGPVQVRFEAQGFTTAEEVAQVPPEAAATLDVALEPLGKGSPATVRGLVRSRTGEALKASVVIKGSSAKVQVSPEGRFFVTVPGGTYLFIISAPGYVTQTKKVVLADGDQAILHTELQKVSR